MAKVSIITRTKDRPLLLERAMQSVISQSFEDWEHIIVNNNENNDEHLNFLIEKYSSQYKNRLKPIKNLTNIDFDPSINIGITAANGKYITIHDDDDSWQEGFLQKTVEFLDKNPKFGAVETYLNYFIEEICENKVKIHQSYPYEGLSKISLYNMFFLKKYPSTISTLFRKKCIDKIGKFNAELLNSGDREFALRFAKKYKMAIIKEYLANCHIRPYSSNAQAYSNCTLGNTTYKDNGIWEKKLQEELFKHNFDLWLYYHFVEFIRPFLEKKTVQTALSKCQGQKIALYGAGIRANTLLKNHKKEFEKLDIIAIFDQSTQKHGTSLEKISILPPGKITEIKPDKIILTVANTSMVKAFIEKLIAENNLQCEIVMF